MTTQGARSAKNTRTTAKPAATDDIELDLTAWLTKRGLVGEKRLTVGGRTFRFVRSATPAQLGKYNEAQKVNDLKGMMAALLVDPAEVDELAAAFEVQPQPIDAAGEQAYMVAIINFLVAGDVGESSAS